MVLPEASGIVNLYDFQLTISPLGVGVISEYSLVVPEVDDFEVMLSKFICQFARKQVVVRLAEPLFASQAELVGERFVIEDELSICIFNEAHEGRVVHKKPGTWHWLFAGWQSGVYFQPEPVRE